MAETEDTDQRLKVLTTRAEVSRRTLTHAGADLKAAVNVSRRVETSIRGNMTTWLGSAALIGVILAKLPPRKKKVYVSAKTGEKMKEPDSSVKKGGVMVAAFGIIFQMVRPTLQKFVIAQAKTLAEKHFNRRVAEGASPAQARAEVAASTPVTSPSASS
jgi:hypothetical protein